MQYFKMPERYCPITGWCYYDGPKDMATYKKRQQEKYRKTKAKKQAAVVAMYDRELKAVIVENA